MAKSPFGNRMKRRAIKLLMIVFATFLALKKYHAVCLFDSIISAVVNYGRTADFYLDDFTGRRIDLVHAYFTNSSAVPVYSNSDGSSSLHVLCPELPSGLVGRIATTTGIPTSPEGNNIDPNSPKVLDGGIFSPAECKARNKVAIIVPFRNREPQLQTLMKHMHPIWQRQQLYYKLFTITQSGEGLFNRAKLMNIGVSEARKDEDFDCYVFHDTDLLLEDDRCLYWCYDDNPRQIAKHIDVFSYNEISYSLQCNPLSHSFRKVYGFGGVSMLTKKQFDDVNGYSNLYWGWGGEDDDMFMRLWKKGYSVENPHGSHCSFRMIKHKHENKNAANPVRQTLLFHSMSRMAEEGYSTLRYRILSRETNPLYTNITVDIGKPSMKMIDFMSKNFNWFTTCIAKMPWMM